MTQHEGDGFRYGDGVRGVGVRLMGGEGRGNELRDGRFAETCDKLVSSHSDFTSTVPHVDPVIIASPYTVVSRIIASSWNRPICVYSCTVCSVINKCIFR